MFEVGRGRAEEWLEAAFRALGPLRPAGMRRMERVRELTELLGRAGVQHAQWLDSARRAEGGSESGGEAGGPDAVSEAPAVLEPLEPFDLERGASGRPRPVGEYVPGTTTVSGARKWLGNGSPGRPMGAWVRLDHAVFEVGDARTRKVVRLPVAGPGVRAQGRRRVPEDVAELVWFEALVPLGARSTRGFRERALLLLDARGHRLAVVENIPFSPEEVFQLARAAGVPAAAYRVRCLDGQAEEIQDVMFPRRAGGVRGRG